MICPKCGREIPDGTVCPCSYETVALSSNPAVNVIKSVGSSTVFLVMAILSTAAVILGVLSNLTAMNGVIPAYLFEVYDYLGIDPSIYESALETAGASTGISVVVSTILSGLTVLALWLHYFTCRNQNSGNISTAGLTIWKVFTWISIVALIIACAAIVLLIVVMALGIGGAMFGSDNVGVVIGVVVFLTIILGALLGLLLTCEIAKLRVINRAKTIAYNGIPDNRVSQFLVVLTCIGGAFSALSGLISLFGSPLSGMASLASGAASILAAFCLTRYRKEMTAVMYPPVQPVYVQQPVYTQPAPPAAPVVEPAVPQQPAEEAAPAAEPSVEQPDDPAESEPKE